MASFKWRKVGKIVNRSPLGRWKMEEGRIRKIRSEALFQIQGEIRDDCNQNALEK
jgi:hypothetical protein